MDKIISKVARETASEIYNPVTLIKGYVDLLERRMRDGVLQDLSLDTIFKEIQLNCKRATDIAESLQDLTMEEVPDKLVLCTTVNLVERAANLFSEKIKKQGIKLQIQHENDKIQFKCHLLQVVQLLTCVLNLAIDRVKTKSVRTVSVTTSLQTDIQQSKWIVIRVQDSGSPQQQLPNVEFCKKFLERIEGRLELAESPFGACLELRFKIELS